MQKDFSRRSNISEISVSLFVLLILLLFTYGIFVRAPYTGFRIHPTTGRIVAIYTDYNSTPPLQLEDSIVRVGSVTWDEYSSNGRQPFFENVQKGDNVEIVVERDGEPLTTLWKTTGFSNQEFSFRFLNIWWLAYIYWFFGSAVQILIRPRETIRRLLIAANHLTALFLIFGSLSGWHLWESSIFVHAITWLIMPVYIHLHWIFPKPLRLIPKWGVWSFYGVCLALAIAEWFQVLPRQLYTVGFLIAIGGSMLLQLIHFLKWPEQRRPIILLAIPFLLVVIPLISLVATSAASTFSYFTFLTLPFIPLGYFYVIYRRQMGGMEVRFNRLISIYAYLILIGTILLILLRPATLLPISHETLAFLTLVVATLAVLLSILFFPNFQRSIDKSLLGIKLPYQNLQEVYSARIATSTSITGLMQLLEEEVFPSLLVRQYAVMQVSNSNLKTLLAKNVDSTKPPNAVNELNSRAGKYIASFSSEHEWIRLILPLKAGDSLVGFWLLGRRDPDDLYPQAEIPILQSLASQTAIALSNINHAEQLRVMFQADINRYEKERMGLALELHDSILNGLAVLRNNLDQNSISPRFQDSYLELTHRLREIVSDLRPPMLMYGLKPAIEELADNLMERNGDKVKIHVDIQASDERVPENIEQHLYRIVQEGCENALKHSQAERIGIFGTLSQQKIDLVIEDDGKGFDSKLELNDLIMNNHFGLAGMIERAHLIDAQIDFKSSPHHGTQIYLAWSNNSTNT